MTFQSEIQNIIYHFNETNSLQNDDTSDASLLSNLSSYMYDTTLDAMIRNEQYSKDIDNLQFNYPQINVILSYLTDLKPEYHKKCMILCYMFLKIRGIDTPIVTPPDFSLDPGIDPASGPILGLPSVGIPAITRPSFGFPSIKLPSFKLPAFLSRSKPTSEPVPTSNVESCDPKEFEIINIVDAVLDKFAEFIISSKDPSIEQFDKDWFKLFLEKAKTKSKPSIIAFQDAVYALNESLQDLRNVIDKQIEEIPAPELVASLTNAKQLYTQITDEKNKIITIKSANVKVPYEKPADFLKDYPIKKSKTCTTERETEKENEAETEKEKENEKEKEKENENEKEKELANLDLLIISGLLLLLDDDFHITSS